MIKNNLIGKIFGIGFALGIVGCEKNIDYLAEVSNKPVTKNVVVYQEDLKEQGRQINVPYFDKKTDTLTTISPYDRADFKDGEVYSLGDSNVTFFRGYSPLSLTKKLERISN